MSDYDEAYGSGYPALKELKKLYAYADYYDFASGELEARIEGTARGFERLAREARELIGHQHQWDDQDLCIICGLDGRS